MYKVRIYTKTGLEREEHPAFATLEAVYHFVDYRERFGDYCVIEVEREEIR